MTSEQGVEPSQISSILRVARPSCEIVVLLNLLTLYCEAGPLLVPVEVPGVSPEAGAAGEDAAAERAGELDVVDVLRLQVVLQVGHLGRLVGAQADAALDDRSLLQLYSIDHTFQHSLVFRLACEMAGYLHALWLTGRVLMGIVNVASQRGPAVLLDVAEGAEVLDALEVAGLHVLDHVTLGVCAATLGALPLAARDPAQVGGDEGGQVCRGARVAGQRTGRRVALTNGPS